MQIGKQTDLILLDLSKAFDKVAHEKLLKLHQYCISGDTLNMIKDFLDNQKQTVVINGINSDEVPVFSGVPQGSFSVQFSSLHTLMTCPSRSNPDNVSNIGKICGICNLILLNARSSTLPEKLTPKYQVHLT